MRYPQRRVIAVRISHRFPISETGERLGKRRFQARPAGFEGGGRSYFARASFSDPDGNRWQLQEITTRLPGREWED